MGIERRGLLATAVGAVAILSGCNPFRPSLETAVVDAVSGVDGVQGADLEAGREAEFRPFLSGTISLDAAGSDAVGRFDEAMRAVVVTIHGHSDEEREGSRLIGGVVARDAAGTTLDVTSLIDVPAKDTRGFPTDDSGLGDVVAADLYERYGLSV